MRFTGGLPETACGYGSTMRATENVRAELPGLLARLGTKVLLDAPCGDLNWIAKTNLGGIVYIGVDASAENIATARRNAPARLVGIADALNDPLPPADTILCRDFLQHLPTAMALRALENFKATGAKWLIATSHDEDANEDIAEVGGFRPVNMSLPPFGLGEPVHSIADGPGRILGVWSLC